MSAQKTIWHTKKYALLRAPYTNPICIITLFSDFGKSDKNQKIRYDVATFFKNVGGMRELLKDK